MMQGLMQPFQLTVDGFLAHARRWHPAREIVTRSVDGPIVRTTYLELSERARRLSTALLAFKVQAGDRIATMAWNTAAHMEAWYAIVGIGAVCHTLNPRLHPEQIAWIINHAEDKIIFAEAAFLPAIRSILPLCPSVEAVVVMSEAGAQSDLEIPTFSLNSLIDAHTAEASWGGFGEETAAGLCYTSGTTGDPKGVLYSHRSNYLHTLVTLQHDVFSLSALDTVLPIVPMFHANAWGLTYSCPAVGAKMVLPGARLDGAAILELIEAEAVTFAAGVPTVFQVLLQHLGETRARPTTLKRVLIGGAAAPDALVRSLEDDYGVQVLHAWGMTEVSPLGTVASPTPDTLQLSSDRQFETRLKQGRPPCAIDLKLTDDEGNRLPHDGHTSGRLSVRGPYVAAAYYKGAATGLLDDEGFFDTGDVCTIDPDGFMRVTDRAKDVIKSGGEWISSIGIENFAVGHPKAAVAAVIGVPHPKWDERPLLIVQLKAGITATPDEFLAFLEGKIAKWWMPDRVIFLDPIPLGPTGKIDKKKLRVQVAGLDLTSATPAISA
jgi:fatty-acyl-CoA synthase